MTITLNPDIKARGAMWLPRRNKRRYAAPATHVFTAWVEGQLYAPNPLTAVSMKQTRGLRVEL